MGNLSAIENLWWYSLTEWYVVQLLFFPGIIRFQVCSGLLRGFLFCLRHAKGGEYYSCLLEIWYPRDGICQNVYTAKVRNSFATVNRSVLHDDRLGEQTCSERLLDQRCWVMIILVNRFFLFLHQISMAWAVIGKFLI